MMTIKTITIRQADIGDIPDPVHLRRSMFESMGYHDPEQLAAAGEAATAYLNQAIPKGEFYGWLAITPSGRAIGSGGVVLDRHRPGPSKGKRDAPEHRQKSASHLSGARHLGAIRSSIRKAQSTRTRKA